MKKSVIALVITIFIMSLGCTGTRPSTIGISNGSLAKCPSSPNCVSSMHTDNKHYIEPFTFEIDKAKAFEILKKIVLDMERTKLIEEKENYLYFEFKTKLMGYVDDVEFYFQDNKVQLRSASRLGYSDMGLNRKRIEKIRKIFQRMAVKIK